jgi:hypothetical protein
VTLRALAGVLAATAIFALAGCARIMQTSEAATVTNTVSSIPIFNRTPGLDVHAVRAIRTVIIHKIAVMPLIELPDQVEGTLPAGSAESVTADLYARAAVMGGWEVVPQDDVDTVMQQLPPITRADMDQNALQLGRKVVADGVIYGAVTRYRERVGFDYAVQTPAAVAFTLYFVDENTKQVVWTGKFAREQKTLSQNVLDLPSFLQSGARWVRAHDIAAQGIQGALDDLQSRLTIMPVLQGK